MASESGLSFSNVVVSKDDQMGPVIHACKAQDVIFLEQSHIPCRRRRLHEGLYGAHRSLPHIDQPRESQTRSILPVGGLNILPGYGDGGRPPYWEARALASSSASLVGIP